MPNKVAESEEMASSPPILYRDESQTDKLSRKIKEAPFVPIGLAGLVAACAFGAYKYRHRGQMSTSVFLMQLRVAAQSMVVGCMTLGLGYQMYKDYLSPDRKKSSE
ncbi:HIG1 domain family member 1A, mitochondrial-like [Schistocerca gregaria]|uniref:HIG1 domain family member 1A, mitochondrial-like n=1 Tax=Schistocerca gregaria TaxID=7010 RepID=UPI00211E2B76|nr:HIG1 domain family member 1A, mitochondrial-like [Schistocerca gregaria]